MLIDRRNFLSFGILLPIFPNFLKKDENDIQCQQWHTTIVRISESRIHYSSYFPNVPMTNFSLQELRQYIPAKFLINFYDEDNFIISLHFTNKNIIQKYYELKNYLSNPYHILVVKYKNNYGLMGFDIPGKALQYMINSSNESWFYNKYY